MASLDPYRYIPANAPLTKAQIEAMVAEQRKKDEAAAAAAKKTSSSSNKSSSTYNTAKQNVASTNPTSYNTAQYYAAQALQNAGQTVPQPKTPIEEYLDDVRKYTTASSIVNSNLSTSYNTAELEAAKAVNAAREARIDKLNSATSANKTQNGNGYVPVADLNRPAPNTGLTTEDARKEHIAVMNDPTLNIPTDGEITLGWVKGDGGGGGNGGGNKNTVNVTDNNVKREDTIIPNPNPNVEIPQVYYGDTSGGGGGGYSGDGGGGSSSGSGYYDGAKWMGGMSYKPYPTAEEMAEYVTTILNAAKTGLGNAIKPDDYLVEANKPGKVLLRPLKELAETFDIKYDYDELYDIFNDSVEKKYDAIYERQKQNEDKYYDNAIAAQNTLIDTLARDRGSAVQAGVSKGMQAANALASMLGVSQQFASNATALSQERGQTAKEYGSDLAQAVVDAEATSNERKNAIMEISKMLYGYDSEQYVADMDNYNTILTNNAALQQSYMNNHTALQNALASIFGGVAANKITGDANVQSNMLTSDATKYAADKAAAAQIHAANQSLVAQQAAAQASKDAQQIYADAMRDSALIGSGTYSGLLSNGTEFTGALAGNEIGTGTGTDSNKSNNLAMDALTKSGAQVIYDALANYDVIVHDFNLLKQIAAGAISKKDAVQAILDQSIGNHETVRTISNAVLEEYLK